MRVRTGFSFNTAYGHLAQVFDKVKGFGWGGAPISDRNSTFGFRKWRDQCVAANIKPVYGVELAVAPPTTQTTTRKWRHDYWTFFAIDDIADLHTLIAKATARDKPAPYLLYKEALNAKGVITIMGERTLIDSVVGPDLVGEIPKTLFMALSPSLPIGLYKDCVKAGIPFVATSDNYYLHPEDKETYRVALGIFKANTQTYPMHLMGSEDWALNLHPDVSNRDIISASNNRTKIIEACNVTLRKAELLRPEKPKTLRQMCMEGAWTLGLVDPSNAEHLFPEYEERLDRELTVITEKKFEDYFYVIEDIIRYAKQEMIVGPARGSSCGSLVCYLLGITTVDPVRFGLLFERFIDLNRKDLPDIDIDFSETRRNLVFEYARRKYGEDHVARLGTVGNLKALSTLNQCSKSLKIPKFEIDRLEGSVIERADGDSRALNCIEDTFNETEAGQTLIKSFPELSVAYAIEGHPASAGQHAAGVVITQEPVDHYVAIDSRTRATMCDKRDAEEFNLLKIDALGLTQLSVFERCLELMGRSTASVGGFLERIPLDDRDTLDIFNAQKFSGIFQFNGPALQGLTKRVQIDDFEDLVAITSLARPGPAAAAGQWVDVKNGQAEITYPHPLFEPILKDTLGVITYQEQIMRICREVGGMSWEDVSACRKAMGKSMGPEYMNKWGEPFKTGAVAAGVPLDVAERVWTQMCAFGSYAFNRSHAVAYSMISYWCAWFKAHAGVVFAAATLDFEHDPFRQMKMLREMDLEGITYQPVNVEISTRRWEIGVAEDGKAILIGPLTMIKGVGPTRVNQLIDYRKRGFVGAPPQGLGKIIEAIRVGTVKTEIDTLYPVRDFLQHYEGHLPPNVHDRINIRDIKKHHEGEFIFVGTMTKAPKEVDMNEPERVAKRGNVLYKGQTLTYNLYMQDETDEVIAKIGTRDYNALKGELDKRVKDGANSIFLIRGNCNNDIRLVWATKLRYLGETDKITKPNKATTGVKGWNPDPLLQSGQPKDIMDRKVW